MKSSSCLFAAMLFSVVAISVTKADCGDPPSIPNATNNITGTSPYPQDTTIRYDCELGYNPVGTSRFYTCTGTTWTDGNFRCEQIYCSHVETPENGRLENTPTYEVGTIIQFACNEGHAMSGQNKMLCRIDGEWLPSTPPTCTARDCGEFGSIQDADLFQDNSYIERNHYGSVVEVTCLDGTTLIGSPQVKCQANGEWGLRPTCEDVQCPSYPNTDSPCISELQTFGVYLFINCKEDVGTHFGPNAAECISGQWDTTEMGCLCDCILPDYNTSSLSLNGLNGHGNLPHATKLDWTCHGTSVKSSLKRVKCLDGNFHIKDDQDNNMIYSNPSDFTRIILPQLCYLPPLVSSSSVSSQPSTTTSTTSDIWSKPETKSSQSKTLHSSMSTQVTVSPQSIMLSSTISSPVTASTQSITPSFTMSTLITASSQSTTPSSTISSPVTASSQSIMPSSTMSTTLSVSSQSITPSFTMSTLITASSQSITSSSTMSTTLTASSQSITSSSTMSTTLSVSSQSITPSFTMSTLIPVTASSQSITPSSTMSTPITASSQSITPSSTMSTPVTASSQSITPQSTMSTSLTVSSHSITPSSTMPTPITASSQSITTSSTMSTPVTVSLQSITPSSTMFTSVTVTSLTISTQSTTLPSTMSTQVTVLSLSTNPFTISSLFTLQSKSISTMSSLKEISSRSISPYSSISIQDAKMLKEITSSCSMPSTVTVLSKSVTFLSIISPQVPLVSKIISSTSTSLLSTMTSKLTTVPVYSASSSMPTPLTDETTTGTYGVQNSTLYNAKDTDSTSRDQIYINASTDNMSKEDSINSGTIHFDFFLGSSICCIFQMFHILWLKL